MAKVLSDASNKATGKALGKKTVEETYQKKTQLEHILLRPDTYVGSIEKQTSNMWIFDQASGKIRQKAVTYVPGLFKIFDEILVNAADNKQRDPTMSTIRVDIDAKKNQIRVWNDGKGIPVAVHKEHGVYVPELIFGHLLTGSNFDDEENKTTGGRNGYGAKLANIFSTEFTIETADSINGLSFKRTWRNNMSQLVGEAKVSAFQPSKKQGDFTCVTFSPDLQRFKMTTLDEDTIGLMAKRAYDIASSASCHTKLDKDNKKLVVYLNGQKVPVSKFEDFIALHDNLEPPVAVEQSDDGLWTIGIAATDTGSMQQLSFVNSIHTSKGGTHVNAVADIIVQRLLVIAKKKMKDAEIKPTFVKAHLAIYVDALIVNPAFDSQTKETLTTRPLKFGSKLTLSEKFLKAVEKSDIIDRILVYAKFKEEEKIKKTLNSGNAASKRARLTGIPKLDDANFAGGARSQECTLILTEGDSAKALAVSGLAVVGRDTYGVFPLKGKPLNVRDATSVQIMKNEEIQHVVKILGLNFKHNYTTTKGLRYGHLMIMTDQDHDGSHIKGLLINMFHKFWPSLLQLDGFLRVFVTPIVKAIPKFGSQALTFFTMPEYEAWKQHGDNQSTRYTIKYYKGLGTSTAKEAKEYFSQLDTHQLNFQAQDDDLAQDGDLIDMAFSKKRAEDRRIWLSRVAAGTHIDFGQEIITYPDFINKELVLFSMADNIRSIPCLVDGLKPSQRKILFACFKRKLKQEIKVAQLAGYVSEHAAYHHGEMSLVSTIVNMAQDFCGSNNLNLLTPAGQFGTRIMGGKDSASARYIFTKLEPVARLLFHPDDDAVLEYLDDDGQSIEPKYYIPVIPLVLCNGVDGIGTGHSSSIPNYDPRQIINELKAMITRRGLDLDLEDDRLDANDDGHSILYPNYRGFRGTINPRVGTQGGFICTGLYERIDDETIQISELPPKKWTQDYRQFLEAGVVGSEKEAAWIKDWTDNGTETSIQFTVKVTDPKILDNAEKSEGGLAKLFKLTTSISVTNYNLFDAYGVITKYNSPYEIMDAFYKIRIEFYQKRKANMLNILNNDVKILNNKVNFVLAVVESRLHVNNRKKQDIIHDLQAMGFDAIDPAIKKNTSKALQTIDEEDSDEDTSLPATTGGTAGYDYLLKMPIFSLTLERVNSLRAELASKNVDLNTLHSKSECDIWLEDLDAILAELDTIDARREREQAEAPTVKGGGAAKKRAPVRRKPATTTTKSGASQPANSRKRAAKGRGISTSATLVEFSPAKASPLQVKRSRAAPKPSAAAPPKPSAPRAPAPPKPKPPAKPTKSTKSDAAPKKVIVIDDDDDDDSDEDMETVVVERKTPRPTRATRGRVANYRNVIDIDDSDDDLDLDDSEDDDDYFG
mmetsp:Transcript_3606/g.5489  ORF Transcript_3606/g.5489 Transcript_3606/m.5489 type:complete len:1381 (+) Transcript_3606:89-4231(+)